jgi:hypothetical protein
MEDIPLLTSSVFVSGPLKWLIKISHERDEPIPALLYEAELDGNRQERAIEVFIVFPTPSMLP